MPINGLGTYSLLDDTCVESVKTALKDGVRLIDTAYMYKNEVEVGQAIRESMEELGIQREDIFVITKLYPGEQYENPERAIEDALEKLDIGYIDMMLLHHPGDNDVKAYKAMEQAVVLTHLTRHRMPAVTVTEKQLTAEDSVEVRMEVQLREMVLFRV